MPRRHREKGDNVIPFQTTRSTTPQTEQEEDQGMSLVIKKIDENRTAGLKSLDQKCDNFDHREMVTEDNPVDENTLRDLEGAIKSATQTLEAVNSLVDMLRHDIVGCIQNVEAQSMSSWQMSAHFQTLLTLMKEKGLVVEEDLKATWDKIIPEQIKKLQEANKQPTEPTEPTESA